MKKPKQAMLTLRIHVFSVGIVNKMTNPVITDPKQLILKINKYL